MFMLEEERRRGTVWGCVCVGDGGGPCEYFHLCAYYCLCVCIWLGFIGPSRDGKSNYICIFCKHKERAVARIL